MHCILHKRDCSGFAPGGCQNGRELVRQRLGKYPPLRFLLKKGGGKYFFLFLYTALAFDAGVKKPPEGGKYPRGYGSAMAITCVQLELAIYRRGYVKLP
ncbi:hypothetical protein MCEGE14_02885 [Burkholderiaceae bacterium]